jgi:FkbM family methyltransferase
MTFFDRICLKIRHYHSALGLKGVALFLLSKVTGKKFVVDVNVPGIAHPVKLRIGTTDISTYKQVLVERQYEFDRPTHPEFIIDAGANVGLATVYFANRYPHAKIVSIEPEESNYRMLCENAKAYPQVTPVRGALWLENKDLFLFDSGHGNHGFQTGADKTASGSRVGSVPGLTIDSIIRDAGQHKVGLLKIDIEGAEREVLENSAAWINQVEVLMVELHDDIKPGCSKAFYEATRGFSDDVLKGETIMRYALSRETAGTSA